MALSTLLTLTMLVGVAFGELMANYSTTMELKTKKGMMADIFHIEPTHIISLSREDGNGGMFVGSVTIGTATTPCFFCLPENPQRLRLAFDTGSSDLVVFGDSVANQMPQGAFRHSYFHRMDSESFSYHAGLHGDDISFPVVQGYRFHGTGVEDSIQLGRGGEILDDVVFAVIERIVVPHAQQDLDIACDGYLGLGFEDMSALGVTPPFIRMINEGLIDEPVISFHFSSRDTGRAIVGSISEHFYDQTQGLHFVSLSLPFDKRARWTIPFEGLEIGDGETYFDNVALLVTTGLTELFAASPTEIDAIVSKTKAGYHTDGKVVIKCSHRQQLDDIIFNIDGRKYSFSGEEYFVKYSPLEVAKDLDKKDLCYLNVLRVDAYYHAVLGTGFMEKYYTVFDYGAQGPESRRIGFGIATKLEESKLKKKGRRGNAK